MSVQPNKSSIKRFVSLAGVVSASLFLNFPARAITSLEASGSNQMSNNYTYATDSTVSSKEVLAQGSTGGGQTPAGGSDTDMQPPSDGDNTENMQPPTGGGSGGGSTDMQSPAGGGSDMQSPAGEGSTGDQPPAPDANNAGTKPAAPTSSGGTLKPGSWECINNPNPQCRR